MSKEIRTPMNASSGLDGPWTLATKLTQEQADYLEMSRPRLSAISFWNADTIFGFLPG